MRWGVGARPARSSPPGATSGRRPPAHWPGTIQPLLGVLAGAELSKDSQRVRPGAVAQTSVWRSLHHGLPAPASGSSAGGGGWSPVRQAYGISWGLRDTQEVLALRGGWRCKLTTVWPQTGPCPQRSHRPACEMGLSSVRPLLTLRMSSKLLAPFCHHDYQALSGGQGVSWGWRAPRDTQEGNEPGRPPRRWQPSGEAGTEVPGLPGGAAG